MNEQQIQGVVMQRILLVLILSCLCAFPLQAAGKDVQGSKDHELISRYKNSTIIGYRASDYDAFRIPLSALKRDGLNFAMDDYLDLEGRLTLIAYEVADATSTLKVMRNFEQAMKAAGFESLFQCAGKACGMQDIWDEALDQVLIANSKQNTIRYMAAKKVDGKNGIYVGVYVMEMYSGKVRIALNIIESKEMETGLVDIDAESLNRELEKNGKVAVYGIYFDHDKADLKESSFEVLEQIKRLLEMKQDLSLYVVGHTDDTGNQSHNLDLSRRRAEAVVMALTSKYGVSASRLSAFGAGPYSPVASNFDESGKTKNRRVELVRRLR
jgi:outer membrane protein OmpA-like peptidoglycan-associated protein